MQYSFLYRFYSCLQHALERETVTNSRTNVTEPSDTDKKKKMPEKSPGKHITKENDKELENPDDDDPGISVTFFPEDY